MTSTAAILKAARDLIAKPENRTQGEYARGPDGKSFFEVGPEATCFCSIGAVSKAMGCPVIMADKSEAVRFLIKSADVSDASALTVFNDQSSHDEVLDLFSKAIKAAEGEQS